MKKTACYLIGLQYAAGSGVSFGLEAATFKSSYFLSDSAKTNQIMFSAILSL